MGDTIVTMIKISLLVGLVMAVLWVCYQQYGITGFTGKEGRGRHCARGRGKMLHRGQHRKGVPVGRIITSAQTHILPSRYYAAVRPSRRGMAHAA